MALKASCDAKNRFLVETFCIYKKLASSSLPKIHFPKNDVTLTVKYWGHKRGTLRAIFNDFQQIIPDRYFRTFFNENLEIIDGKYLEQGSIFTFMQKTFMISVIITHVREYFRIGWCSIGNPHRDPLDNSVSHKIHKTSFKLFKICFRLVC